MSTIYLVVIDGLGAGAQEDAGLYGDEGSNTLAHVVEKTGCRLPNLVHLGLANILPLKGLQPVDHPSAAFGRMRERSAGKDSTTGHWEMAGIYLEKPFPVYPDGFPEEIIRPFCKLAGVESVWANKPYSGTKVIEDFGVRHLNNGCPIVYTSSDSVFQVAAHVDVTPVKKLYEWCERTRNEIMTGRHAVGRVIARPFEGESGSFHRISEQRHDFSLKPPVPNLPALLYEKGIKTYAIGKIIDLFGGEGFTQYRRTGGNAEGIAQLLNAMAAMGNEGHNLVFVNLIDTDQLYGHRNDPAGYAHALEEIDRAIPAMLSKMRENDVLILTGDHGNDPTTKSTDHSREFVPLLVCPEKMALQRDLGIRPGFGDIAVSAAEYFGVDHRFTGTSFLKKTLK